MSRIRCPICKNHYENYGLLSSCCPSCSEKQDKDYIIVREFVKQHQGVNISVVVEETGVSYSKIIGYVKMEMLEITPDSQTMISCAVCGVKLYTGVLCDDCKKRHGSGHKMLLSKAQAEQEKMRLSMFEEESTQVVVVKRKKRL